MNTTAVDKGTVEGVIGPCSAGGADSSCGAGSSRGTDGSGGTDGVVFVGDTRIRRGFDT